MTTSNVTVCIDEFLLGGEGSFLGFHYAFLPPGIITSQLEDVRFVEGLNIFIQLNKINTQSWLIVFHFLGQIAHADVYI